MANKKKRKPHPHFNELWRRTNPWYAEIMKIRCQVLAGWMSTHGYSPKKVEALCNKVTIAGQVVTGCYPTQSTIRRLYEVGTGQAAPYFVNDFVFTKIFAAMGCDPLVVSEEIQQILVEERRYKTSKKKPRIKLPTNTRR